MREEEGPHLVMARPGAAFWGTAAVLLVVAAAIPFGWCSPSKQFPEGRPFIAPECLGLTALFLLPALLGLFWAARCRIVADGAGLRWRHLGGWHSVRWSEVEDFHLAPPPGQSRNTLTTRAAVVETRGGGRVTFADEWAGHKELRAAVRERATAARAREWDVKGTRPEDDWPRVFRYRRRDAWGAWLGAGLYLGGVAYLSVVFSGRVLETFRLLEIGWTLAVAGTAGLIFVVLPMLAVTVFVRSAMELRRRLDERFTVTPETLTFAKGGDVVSVPWEAVAGFRVARAAGAYSIYELILWGSGERHLTFTPAIRDAGLLLRIVARYAPGAVEGGDACVGNETLGGEAERWSGGIAGSGAQVFHYRTRNGRALLTFPLFFAGALALLSWASANGYTKNGGGGTPSFGVPIACLLAWLWFLWRYRAARIEVDELGIAQRNPWGVRRLPWLAVADYRGAGDPCVIEGRDGTRLRFYASLISDAGELMRQIERRAPKPRTGWARDEAGGAGVQSMAGEREVTDSIDGLEVTPDGGVPGRARR